MKHSEQRPEQEKDLWCKPMLSRYSRDPLPSQIPTPFCFSTPALVLPLMNQSNSSATPAHQTLVFGQLLRCLRQKRILLTEYG